MRFSAKTKGWFFLALGVALLVAVTAMALPVFGEFQAMKRLRYEPGAHKGAAYCGECHEEIYRQWSANSRHAMANTGEEFLDFRDKFTASFIFDSMMGEAMCYGCHGPKSANQGVNCETCHGPAIAKATPEETFEASHQNKFSPRLAALKNEDFCAKCHELLNPFVGDLLLGLYSDWRASPAARKGLTCQGCHMKPDGDGVPYHGFDTAILNVGIYQGDLDLEDIRLDFPRLSMTVVNRVQGHSIPAAGPSKALVLGVDLLDRDAKVVHSITERFAKVFTLTPLIGIMPWKPVENTQLQSGESRELIYTLPDSLKDRLDRAVMTMRFYEISDEHQGDLSKAHWISEPILEKTVRF